MSEATTWTLRTVDISALTDYYKNPRSLSKAQFDQLKTSLDKFGMIDKPIINADKTNTVIGGHQRLQVLRAEKVKRVECWYPSRELDDKEVEELNIRLNKATGAWDFDILANQWEQADLLEWGFTTAELTGLDFGGDAGAQTAAEARKTLAERFIVPPFSVLDARQGYWQKRKDTWIALGIKSELGRGGNSQAQPPHGPSVTQNPDGTLCDSKASRDGWSEPQTKSLLQKTGDSRAVVYGTAGNTSEQSGTSIFDPVLCELVYRWFTPPGDKKVIDPFAGGSVRGIVAGVLGLDYTGIDLQARQIEENEEQAKEIAPGKMPRWIVGDSKNVKELALGEYDLVFSCPPYFDLELYSEDTADLSNAGNYADFISAYRAIIADCVSMLKADRFACFVVGDVRDKRGFYHNFPADTIAAFRDAGVTLYNEAILVTAVGSLPIRTTRMFQSGRKLGKTHQNVLIFYKGDPKHIKAYGDVECGEAETPEQVTA